MQENNDVSRRREKKVERSLGKKLVVYSIYLRGIEEILDKGSPSLGKSALRSVAEIVFVCSLSVVSDEKTS